MPRELLDLLAALLFFLAFAVVPAVWVVSHVR